MLGWIDQYNDSAHFRKYCRKGDRLRWDGMFSDGVVIEVISTCFLSQNLPHQFTSFSLFHCNLFVFESASKALYPKMTTMAGQMMDQNW